jgi:radical SAM superfamily enzyme YgiQ (UPF0313 family)
MNEYHRTIHGQPATHIVTLRGCPFDCAFCATEAIPRKVRFRSVENVMLEVDRLRESYGTKGLVIYDDQFLLSPDRVLSFCEEFGKRDLHWRCWSRADLITPPLLLRMRESGLTSITIGIESGDDFILARTRKRTTAWKNRDALLTCKETGVPVRCSLIYGLPGETPDSLRNTVNLVRTCQPDEWELSIFSPVPGSDIWNRPEAYGVSFDKVRLKAQDYFPINRYGESGIGTLWVDLDTMKREELQARLPNFVGELERVCPRKTIQDTIHRIDPLKAVEPA